jgi:hypothetical protein
VTIQVFISYKSEYRDFARSVKSELNEWGFETWLDVDNIQPGDYFRHKIQEGLDSSDVLLMVLTEEAQLSREVMAEVDYFLDVAKKPVVPLRHRECKPLYIFVSIQYIDFVKDQVNGFVQLKQRLDELAQSAVVPASEARPEPIAEPDLKPGAAVTADEIIVDKEKKEAVLEDFLSGGMAEEEAPPKPPPPPPKPITQQPQEFGSMPAAPIAQPQRQAEYNIPMQQPAATRSKSSRSLVWPLAAVASLVVVVGAVVLLNSNAALPPLSVPSQGTSPLVWVVAAVVVGASSLIVWRLVRNRALPSLSNSTASTDRQQRETAQQPSPSINTDGVTDTSFNRVIVLRHKDFGDYVVPPNTDVLNLFTDLNGEALILGTPDDSKRFLLELERKIKVSLQNNADLSTPYVLNLLSWKHDQSLNDWLLSEIPQHYQNHKEDVTSQIEGQKLSLLLDGLELMTEQDRNACIDAINVFRNSHREIDFAICGRVEDYDLLTFRFDLRSAIVLQLESLGPTAGN